jgi:hypothetical protein
MTVKVNGYVLTKKTTYWFYKEDSIPDYAEPVDDFPAGFEVVKNARNHFPFLKRVKTD